MEKVSVGFNLQEQDPDNLQMISSVRLSSSVGKHGQFLISHLFPIGEKTNTKILLADGRAALLFKTWGDLGEDVQLS